MEQEQVASCPSTASRIGSSSLHGRLLVPPADRVVGRPLPNMQRPCFRQGTATAAVPLQPVQTYCAATGSQTNCSAAMPIACRVCPVAGHSHHSGSLDVWHAADTVAPCRICIIAGDISPIDVVIHLPVMCEDRDIPYIYVPSKDVS